MNGPRGDLDFVLGDPGRPQKANDLSFARVPQTCQNFCRALAQITGRGRDLPFLVAQARKNFDLRSDCTSIVGQRFQIQAHPTVFVSALVAQKRRGAAYLRNEQISRTSAGEIGRDHGLRMCEGKMLERGVARGISEAGAAAIAQQSNLAARLALADGCQIKQAIIIVIESGKSATALPAKIREGNALQPLATYVAPECEAGRAIVGEGKIHPTVLIKVESDHANCRWKIFLGLIPSESGFEGPFPLIEKD